MAINTRLLSITAGSLLCLSFIFFIVSNAVPIWSKFTYESTEITTGLWRICSSAPNIKTCVAISCPSESDETSFCSKILTARAFVTLACILSGISAICLVVYAIQGDKTPRILLLATKGLVFACLIMGIIGVAVGINATVSGDSLIKLDFGAAAIIGIVAIIINFIGAIITALIRP
ncbi:unnamed protein product [Rotaria sp. Silwood2]|nr:unnamed protein product [Rotaria sp. Silwood2]CAF3380952.1 unnamed protein product [Rotaria sp. Silwood2]CAF3455183.1 unnamed protein product [Rotaria sp. Silwood2]CAF4038630.1 unnamed protein product [Rotaria sp. Silwood2]CAF4536773.1 unnamed protein product [Rotaria sp. Silwood2]